MEKYLFNKYKYSKINNLKSNNLINSINLSGTSIINGPCYFKKTSSLTELKCIIEPTILKSITISNDIKNVIGLTGPTCYQRSQGSQGPISLQGKQGPIGLQGIQGKQGYLDQK
jgi:hypothetical protein